MADNDAIEGQWGVDVAPEIATQIANPSSIVGSALRAAFVAQTLPAGITAAGRFDPTRSLYNATAANLRKTRSKLGTVKSGTGLMRIVCAGTSLTAGVGATGMPDAASYPVLLRQLFASRGYATGGTGIAQTWNNNLTNVDARWTYGSGWSGAGADVQFRTSSVANAPATFTTDIAGTTVDVVTLKGSGAFTVSIAGGAAQTVTASSGGGGAVATYATPIGVGQTVVITPTTTSTVYLIGVQIRSASGLLVSNAGVGSSTSGNWAEQNEWNNGRMTSSSVYAPDLVIFEMPVNDALNGTDLATVQANIATAVNQWKAAGADVILVADPAPQTSSVAAATWLTYQQGMYATADALGLPLIDMTDMYGPRATIVSNGLDFDGIHLNSGGYGALAVGVAAAIAA